MKLVYEDGREVKQGDKAKTFRNEDVEVKGWREPHSPSSSGRVYVRFLDRETHSWECEYFPSVIGAKFVD